MSKKCLIFYIWDPPPPSNFESIGYRGLSELQPSNVPIWFIYIPLSFNNYFEVIYNAKIITYYLIIELYKI